MHQRQGVSAAGRGSEVSEIGSLNLAAAVSHP